MYPAPGPSRRRVLVGGAGLLSLALAGCIGDTAEPAPHVGGTGGAAGTDGFQGSTGTDTAWAGGAGTPVATREADSPAETPGEDPLRLPSLTAPGSPGGPLTVVPSGKVVLLDFFATWCGPCEPEMANLRAVRRRFDHASVFMISLTQETDQRAVVRWWEENRGTWPVVVDPTLTAIQRYDVTGLPTILVLARDGTETFRHVGLAGEERLVTALETALAAE